MMARWNQAWAGALLLVLAGCGSLVDEKWKGTESGCHSSNGSSNASSDVELILEGPVTAMPSGQWRIAAGGGSWYETDISDSSYVGPILKFTAEFRTTILGTTLVNASKYELTRTPGKLEGTSKTDSGNDTITCDVSLEPER